MGESIKEAPLRPVKLDQRAVQKTLGEMRQSLRNEIAKSGRKYPSPGEVDFKQMFK